MRRYSNLREFIGSDVAGLIPVILAGAERALESDDGAWEADFLMDDDLRIGGKQFEINFHFTIREVRPAPVDERLNKAFDRGGT